MNINLSENILNDIFHYLGDSYIKENDIYKFPLYPDKKNVFKVEYYKVKKLSSIPDPSIDSNFKAIFNNHSKRFENLLNSIYFEPKDMKISDLVFINDEYNIIGQSFNLNTLRPDIACKGKITISDKKHKEEKELLLDVEILINWIEELEDKLFEYNIEKKEEEVEDENWDLGEGDDQEIISRIHNINQNKKNKKRIYLDTLVIAYILGNSSNNSNVIKLTKVNGYNKFIYLKKFKIVEINTFIEWNKIKNNKENYLFGKSYQKTLKIG